MDNLNQSTVSPKAFPLQPGDSGMSLHSHQRSKAAWHRTVLNVAAWFEIIAGAIFLLAPAAQSQFLFGATPEEIGILFARFAGIGLIGLGIACLPSKHAGTRQGAVLSLLIFNIGVSIFFASIALTTTFRGVLLWPVVILHAVSAIALALSLKHESS